MIEQLNATHAIPGQIEFAAGPNHMPVARIHNAHARAEIHLHGAHVTAYQRHDERPVLWMSRDACFEAPKPIRGGIPICWPWFGSPKANPERPPHGFARNRQWKVRRTQGTADATELTLELESDGPSLELWPHPFKLSCRVSIGASLEIQLNFRNCGDTPAEVATALHSYFAVGDVSAIRIAGLNGRQYHDQLDEMRTKLQAGDIQIASEVDRIYRDTEDECVIHDPTWNRRLRIGKSGSRSTVVWNPWIEKSRRMADFPDDGYPEMVCVETTNAADDVRCVQAGDAHQITQRITPEPGV